MFAFGLARKSKLNVRLALVKLLFGNFTQLNQTLKSLRSFGLASHWSRFWGRGEREMLVCLALMMRRITWKELSSGSGVWINDETVVETKRSPESITLAKQPVKRLLFVLVWTFISPNNLSNRQILGFTWKQQGDWMFNASTGGTLSLFLPCWIHWPSACLWHCVLSLSCHHKATRSGPNILQKCQICFLLIGCLLYHRYTKYLSVFCPP